MVLTMFPVFLRKIIFSDQNPSLGRPEHKKIFFSQKQFKTRFEHFFVGFIWFCVLVIFFFFSHKVSFGLSQSKVKNFLYFYGRFELPKCKVWVFLGVLIFNFWLAIELTNCSQGHFSDPNKKKIFKKTYLEWS